MAITTTTMSVLDGTGASKTLSTRTNPAGDQSYAITLDTPGVAAYRAAANFTPQATAAHTLISVTGSATKTVRIKKIALGGVSTAVSQSILQLQRTTALGTGGTAVTPTVGKMDSGNAAATAVVTHYTTAAQSAGTASGGPITMANIQTGVVTTPATLALGGTQWLFPEGGNVIGGALVLRGATDFMEVQVVTPANLGAGTVLCYVIEWEEDAS